MDWRQAHSHLHPNETGETVLCRSQKDGSLAVVMHVVNPAVENASVDVEFHIDTKCCTAVITEEVANLLGLKFVDHTFFIGESQLADGSNCIASIHPVTLSVSGFKSCHNPTVLAFVSTGTMCLVGSQFLSCICAQLNYSKGTLYMPSRFDRSLSDLHVIQKLDDITIALLRDLYKEEVKLTSAQMRKDVLPAWVNKKTGQDPTQVYRIMAVEVPCSMEMTGWFSEVIEGRSPSLLDEVGEILANQQAEFYTKPKDSIGHEDSIEHKGSIEHIEYEDDEIPTLLDVQQVQEQIKDRVLALDDIPPTPELEEH